MLDGEPLSPREHLEDLITGFRRAYHVILQNREALLSSEGPLAEFKGRKIRVTVRQTSLYRALLRTALAPRFMRDGADLSIQVDRLSRAWLAPDVPAFLWPISRAEHDALTRMDIPRFTTLTNSRSLNLNNGVVVENCFPETGYDLVRAQMVALSEADLEQQVGLIRASFEERLAQPESG
jgi:lantibiotic modifying enzyme